MDRPPKFRLGLGNDRRWNDSTDGDCIRAVERALSIGYRHLDTAQVYENETPIGQAIQDALVPREELTVVTKLHSDHLAYDDIFDCVDERLSALGLDRIDLLYVHWPFDPYDPETTLAAFAELQSAGKIRHIGVSNYAIEMVETAREYADIFALQVEMHPLLPQREIVEYVQKNGLWAIAHTPLARGEVTDIDEIRHVADKHRITPVQATLAWHLQRDNVAAVPKASGDHIQENFESLSVKLDEEDVRRIDSIDRRERFVDPDIAPWNQ